MYERFTDRARKVMQLANQEAQRFCSEYIGTEHILIGLVKDGSGVAASVLKNMDVDLRKIRTEIEKFIPPNPNEQIILGKLPHTDAAKKVVEHAIDEANLLNHNYVGTEHLFLGLLRGNELAVTILNNLGLKIEDVRNEVVRTLKGNEPITLPTINLPPRPVENVSNLYVEGVKNGWLRSGYYCRSERDGDAIEVGFKTHEELVEYMKRFHPPLSADDPVTVDKKPV